MSRPQSRTKFRNPAPPRKKKFPAETQETQREIPTGLTGFTGWGRRRGCRKSKDFMAFRRGCHGDGSRRFTFDRATGQNETLKAASRTLKRENPVPRGREESRTDGKRAKKKISAKIRGFWAIQAGPLRGQTPLTLGLIDPIN